MIATTQKATCDHNIHNILKHELIGLHVRIIKSTNPQLLHLSGVIIHETKQMLTLATKSGTKIIPKGICYWQITIPNRIITNKDIRSNAITTDTIHPTTCSSNIIDINGAKITKRSAERLMIKT